MSKKLKISLIIFLCLVIGGGIFFFYNFYFKKVNYLIKGVPYFGYYNSYLRNDSWAVAVAAEVLGYWGDQRYSMEDLRIRFPRYLFDKNENKVIFYHHTTSDLQRFFRENGYKTYRWVSKESGEELSQIKKFVNADKKIPVIVFQKVSNDPKLSSRGLRLVIGIFDKEKKVIVHDYNYGNNYQISYEDFLKMFQPYARAILAVWPSKEIKGIIKGPNYNTSYPPRLKVMDEMGDLLVKMADAFYFGSQRKYEKASNLLEECVSDPRFKKLPPAHRIRIYSGLARVYLLAEKPDKAIELIKNKALLINKDLNRPYGEWTEQVGYFSQTPEAKSKLPYLRLAEAYEMKGETEKVIENCQKALEINPRPFTVCTQYKDLLKK